MPGPQDPKGIASVGKARQVPAPAGTPATGGVAGIGATTPTYYRWSVTRNDGSIEYYEGPTAPDPTTGQAAGAVVAGTDTDPKVKEAWDKQQAATGEGRVVTGPDGRKYRITGDTMTPLEGQDARDRYHTLPDGSLAVEDPTAPDGLRVVATKPQGPDLNKAPDVHQLADGTSVSWNPATSSWDVIASKQGATPDLAMPADRPGQTTDLTVTKAQAKQYWDKLTQDVLAKRISPEQRDAMWSSYYAGTVQPKIDQANKEVADEAARQRARQQQADARAQTELTLATNRDERAQTAADRQAATDADRLKLEREKFGYSRGQDAVDNALKLLKYQVDPSFGPALAGVYNRIIPGAFAPGAFNVNLPDLDAIAAAHVGPLLGVSSSTAAARPASGLVATPGTRDQWGLPGGLGAPPGAPPPPNPLAGVPVPPRPPGPVPPPYPGSDRNMPV